MDCFKTICIVNIFDFNIRLFIYVNQNTVFLIFCHLFPVKKIVPIAILVNLSTPFYKKISTKTCNYMSDF